VDIVDEFVYVEVPGGLSSVELLLRVKVLSPLIVCIDVHRYCDQTVSLLTETIYNSKQLLIMYRVVALRSIKGFSMVLGRG